MELNTAVKQDFYVLAVTLAARLNEILLEARKISLEAMNAKALVARGGLEMRTFKPITDYMSLLAKETIAVVSDINEAALHLAHQSLQEMRLRDVMRQISVRLPDIEQAPFGQSVLPSLDALETDVRNQQGALAEKIDHLADLLGSIDQKMRAARVVSATARIEAAVCGGSCEKHFLDVAANLETAARLIRTRVTDCRKQLLTASQ